MNSFKINNLVFDYCRDQYNKSYENERSIEIPLGHYFLDKFNDDVFEVGSVMIHYGGDLHTVIDLCEKHPRVLNVNALDADYTNKNVLCISTIEHMMKREYGNGSNEDSITFLKKVINEANNYLITFPPTYNEFLDDYIVNELIAKKASNIFLLKRVSSDNQWAVERNLSTYSSYLFGHRDGRHPDGYYNNANAVCVITNLKELIN